ncbi:MAG: CBS domain-containing protein [Janthinobacterium lividum]
MPIPACTIVTGQKLEKIFPDATFQQALEVMITNEFSQLPVVNEDGVPLGIITTDSIAHALLHC